MIEMDGILQIMENTRLNLVIEWKEFILIEKKSPTEYGPTINSLKAFC